MLKNNATPVIRIDQLEFLLRNILGETFINVDLEPLSKKAILNQMDLIYNKLTDLENKTQLRDYQYQVSRGEIVFDVGEHRDKLLPLEMTVALISTTDKSKNIEININIPKLFFKYVTSNQDFIIDPYITSFSGGLIKYLTMRLVEYRRPDGRPVKCLALSIPNEFVDLTTYDDILIYVQSPSAEFLDITDKNYSYISDITRYVSIPILVNTNQNYIEDDGTVVRSNIVRHIESVSKSKMETLIDNNETNPNVHYLVVDESQLVVNRQMNIKITIGASGGSVSLSNNLSQSRNQVVNWGDSVEEFMEVYHRYTQPGQYTIQVMNRLDDLQLSIEGANCFIDDIWIPTGFNSPCEFNSKVITNPLGADTNVRITTLKGKIFENASRVEEVYGLLQDPSSITTIEREAFKGFSAVSKFVSRNLFKNVTLVDPDILTFMKQIVDMSYFFKELKASYIPSDLFRDQRRLENIEGMFELAKLNSIDSNLLSTNRTIKNASKLFKDVNLAGVDIVAHLNTFVGNKTMLSNISEMYSGSKGTGTVSAELITKLNNLNVVEYMNDLFKGCDIRNGDTVMTLSSLGNLMSISGMLNGNTHYTVNGPLLNGCTNLNGSVVNVSNSLVGTLAGASITSEDDLFIDTNTDGISGIIF
ncbi:MAG: hypothetical protein ACRC92_20700 [Peptostreptococcaceae bacterium]